MKQLTKLQKKIELTRLLKKAIKNDIEPQMIHELEKVIDSPNLPVECYEEKNTTFLDIVINERLQKIIKNFVKNPKKYQKT